MVAGAVGGLIFWAIIFPADVVKSRIQVSGHRASLGQVMLKIYREEGKFLQCVNNDMTITRQVV